MDEKTYNIHIQKDKRNEHTCSYLILTYIGKHPFEILSYYGREERKIFRRRKERQRKQRDK